MLYILNFVTFLSILFNTPSVQNVKMEQERTDAACYTCNSTLKGMSGRVILKLSTPHHLLHRT